jgi:hypothetical protein
VPSHGRLAAHAPAALAYGLLTLVQLWPLVVGLGEVVPSDLGDPLLSMWTLWWNATVLPFTSSWWDGLAFFPGTATLAFSDHRVGLGLIATPIIWLGGSPIVAHNVTFALTFLLSALSAYALGFTLTRSRAAAFVGGLIFGFHPFRAEHLSHLELLAAYWLPVVLLALHRWAATARPRWLVLAAAALTLQALTCGYYFVYFAPLLALWLLWFTPRGLSVRKYAELAAALAAPLVLIAPVLQKYREVHLQMGLARSINEIEQLSADLIGLLTAPEPLAFWNTPDSWRGPEGSLFPGLTAVVLIGVALVISRARPELRTSRAWTVVRRILLGGIAIALGAALVPMVRGPVAIELAGLRVSVSDSYKPFSTATVLFIAWVLTSARVRQAWRQRSALPFYVLATLAMWLFALGPTARLLGERVLYKPPYSWLMLLPGFRDGFRAPARFAMLAAITLSLAAAIAFWRMARGWSGGARLAALGGVTLAILVDSWIAPFRVVAAPSPLVIPAAVPAQAVVLELPIGVFEDASTMYHSMFHGRRMLNGMSGYEPPHYPMLRIALEEGRAEVLSVFAARAAVAVFVPRGESGQRLAALVKDRTGARTVATTEAHEVALLAHEPLTPPPSHHVVRVVRAASIASSANAQHLALMNDGDRLTTWFTPEPQAGGELVTADMGAVVSVAGVTMSLGRSMTGFPRGLVIEVSADGTGWSESWRGETAAISVAAAIDDPRDVTTTFSFASRPARYVRVTQTGQSATHPWAIAEFRVLTEGASGPRD